MSAYKEDGATVLVGICVCKRYKQSNRLKMVNIIKPVK